MLKSFQINPMSEILFGYDMYKQAAPRLKQMGVSKCLVLTDKNIVRGGIVSKVLDTLEQEAVEYIVYDKCEADSPDWEMEEVASLLDSERVDGILTVGGGSVMDVGKLSSIYHANERIGICNYNIFGGKPLLNARKVSLVHMPTTAGTGSEIVWGGPVTDSKTGLKINICHESIRADLVIIDPGFTLSCPDYYTICAALDALAQATEVMLGKERSIVTTLTHGNAVKWIWKYLPMVHKNPQDLEGRYYLALAADFSLSHHNAIQGHVFAHTIGGVYHISHGHACAVTLPETIRYHKDSAPDAIEELARCIGVDRNTPELADAVADAFASFIKSFGIKTPKELGLGKSAEEFASALLPHIQEDPYYYEWVPEMTMEKAETFIKNIWN